MATYTQIQTRAQSMAMSANATDAPLFANEVYSEIVGFVGLNPTTATKTLTAGTFEYDIVADWSLSTLIAIDYITYAAAGATVFDLLQPTSFLDILRENRGSTNGYVRQYALRGKSKVDFAPRPQGGDSVTIYYQATPTALSAGTDTPSLIDSAWQYLVTWGTAARLAQEEGLDIASALEAQYVARRDDYVRWLEEAQGDVSKIVRVGYARSPIRKHDNSEDRR